MRTAGRGVGFGETTVTCMLRTLATSLEKISFAIFIGIAGFILLYKIVKPKHNHTDKDDDIKQTQKKLVRSKTFIDDEEEIEEIDEPSTDTIVKKNQEHKRNHWNRNVRYEEDNESEDEKQDKIFFEMYQTYKHS